MWEVSGPTGAPPVMLLHGWMATAALNWYGSLGHLGQHFRVVAPNLRGHGREGRLAPPFSLAGCTDDLAALIEELGLRKVIAVGYSMGGAVAQVLARRHGDLLGGIVLCATGASFAHRLRLRPVVRVVGSLASGSARAWPDGAAAFLRWRIDRHDREVAGRQAKALGPQGPRANGPSTPAAPAWALEERALSHLAALIEAGAELNAYDSSPWLSALDMPAAVVVTKQDRMVAPWRQERLVRLLPGAQRYEVDAGHDAVVSEPGLFLPVLVRACADLAGRA